MTFFEWSFYLHGFTPKAVIDKKDVPEEKKREIISQYGLRLVKTIQDLNMYVVSKGPYSPFGP